MGTTKSFSIYSEAAGDSVAFVQRAAITTLLRSCRAFGEALRTGTGGATLCEAIYLLG